MTFAACLLPLLVGAAPAHSPDILVVTLDAVRADFLPGFGGDAKALPNFAAWINSGVRFSRAYTTAPLTIPAHASLWTGQEPFVHGLRDQTPPATLNPPLFVVETARQAGYATAAFVATSFLTPEHSRLFGFDHFDSPKDLERPGSEVVRHAAAWINEQPADRPLLVWIHLFEAHFPYRPRTPLWRECPAPAQALARLRLDALAFHFDPIHNNEPWWPRCLRDLYRGELSAMDALVPAVRGLLARRGRYLWGLLSDHGECIGEEGLMARHASTLLECAVHIPLVMGGFAGVAPGGARADLASIIDVGPSLGGRLGWVMPHAQGYDLLAPEFVERPIFFEAAGVNLPDESGVWVGGWHGDERVTLRPLTGVWRAWQRKSDEVKEIDPARLSPTGHALRDMVLVAPPPPRGQSPGENVQPAGTSQIEALRTLGYVR